MVPTFGIATGPSSMAMAQADGSVYQLQNLMKFANMYKYPGRRRAHSTRNLRSRKGE